MLVLLSSAATEAKLSSEVAFYVETYGELTEQQDPQVGEAKRIFKRVLSVADKNSKRMARLVVINNNTKAWAISLPDGHIVLSKQVLEIAHRNADQELAQARLAFVIGHELAHLANDDFWHHEVESFMQNTSDAKKIAQFLNQNFTARQAELAADDKGYIYAAMAGYAVDELVRNKHADQDFFTFWMQQTNTKVSPSHPEAKDRAELLRQRLNQLSEQLAFFHFGTRLAHFGYCNDAIYFLREFQKTFPGRSVLNNLGHCYIQQARLQMSEPQRSFYWLPLTIDTENRATSLTRGNIAGLESPKLFLKNYTRDQGDVAGYLEQAVNILNLAVEKDPDYIPAKLNLAIAYLYQGKPHEARAALIPAKQLSASHPHIEMLDALALYEQTDADMDLWPTAMKKLQRMENSSESMYVLYNQARLYALRPRPSEAQQYWNRLNVYSDFLPLEVRQELCNKQNLVDLATCMHRKIRNVKTPNWNWLFTTSLQPLTDQQRLQIKTKWQSIPFDWAASSLNGFMHERNDGLIEILELNHTVQVQVLKGNPVADLKQIDRYCKFPLIKRKLDIDEIWTCDHWAVKVADNKAREIWYMQK